MFNNSRSSIKPFTFQLPQTEDFNQILLDNLDLAYLEATGDMAHAIPFLKNFVQSKFTSDTIRSMSYPQFDKMLKICQQSMTFYTQNQEQKEAQIDERLQELRAKQDKLAKLQELEKQHQEKQANIKKDLENLKIEAQKAKEHAAKQILFKCHHCDKFFQDKESVNKHIQNKHLEKAKDDITNPEFLTSMLQQLQQVPQGTNPAVSRFNQTGPVGTLGQTMQSLPDPATLGSAGFQQLKMQHQEKMEAKQRRREQRREKREQDRQERMNRIKQQEDQMLQFQNQIQGLVEKKIADMIKLHQNVTNQQQDQVEQQKRLLKELEELRNLKFQIKDHSEIKEFNESKSKDDEILVELNDKQPDLDMSQQSLLSNQQSKDMKLLISKNQQAVDQSGMVSFQNYSESVNSAIQMKQQADGGKEAGGGQKQLIQAEMAHIGELESDNEDQDADQNASYLRPLNKKSKVEHYEEDFIRAVYRKNQKQVTQEENSEQEDEEIDLQEDDVKDAIKKERTNILGDQDSQDPKELKQNLYRVQQRVKE